MCPKSTDSSTRPSKSSKTSLRSGSNSKISFKISSADEEYLESWPEEEEDVYKLPPKTGEYYYQDMKYVKPTQAQFDRKQIQDSKLFDKNKKMMTVSEQDIIEDLEPLRDASILVTGFGMRNVKSFQNLIKMSHEEREKWKLKKLWRDQQVRDSIIRDEERKKQAEAEASERIHRTEISTATDTGSRRSSSDFLTQTDTTTKLSDSYTRKEQLDYLLGLEPGIEEEPDKFELEKLEMESEDDFKYSSSKSIREGQKYLREHRIFECFQFIVTHLLSANAENPIEFILNLLNKCLLYRSGLGEPPLLYDRKHINQLFNLMDRLQSGFIEIPQYKSGMKTLGICTFNEDPETNDEGLITRETFIEEAYEAELAIFNELIKRRPIKGKKADRRDTEQYDIVSLPSRNPPFFIPSSLFKFSKHLMDLPEPSCEE